MNGNKAHATAIKAGTYDQKKEVTRPKERVIARASTIAGDEFVKINFYHPLLREKFPGNPKMWSVDKCYPMAKGGPLLVDEPKLDYRIQECKRKLAEFEAYNKTAKVKIRYLILKGGVEPLNELEGTEF